MTTESAAPAAPRTRKDATPMEQLFNVAVFVVFVVAWAAFAWALVANQGGLHAVWEWLRNQHVVIQAVVWLLFLPVTFGLWIWESGWPLVVRLALVLSIGGFNLWLFFPKGLFER